jgi:NTE family protein
MTARTRIAIACQGGGSQTAFTAGALAELLRQGVHREFEIVSLSGTSGGAICAAMVWAGLRLGDADPAARLLRFWADNAARLPGERWLNQATLATLRIASRGQLPLRNTSPASPGARAMRRAMGRLTRPHYLDLGAMLERHLDPAELAGLDPAATPILLLGAVDVLSGRMREFTSREGPIRTAQLLASAAVPELFEAVDAGDCGPYWDGLFSDNPPLGELIREDIVGAANIPDEIWIVRINPTRRASVPLRADEISDRRNELYGNISILHQLANIAKLNDLFLADAFRPEYLERAALKRMVRIPRGLDHKPVMPYHIPWIEMSPALAASLDYESKLDRSAAHFARLIEDGARQAARFLAERAATPMPR